MHEIINGMHPQLAKQANHLVQKHSNGTLLCSRLPLSHFIDVLGKYHHIYVSFEELSVLAVFAHYSLEFVLDDWF